MQGHVRSRKTKNGISWQAVIYLGKRTNSKGKFADCYRWISGFRTKKAAQDELVEQLKARKDGKYVEVVNDTLSSYLDRWLDAYAKPKVSGKTFERYSQIVNRNIKPALGNARLQDLQPMRVQEFYSKLLTSGRAGSTPDKPRGLNPRSVLHVHRILKEALKQAVKWRLIAFNPLDAVEPPVPPRVEMKAIDEVQTAWLMQAAAGTSFYLPVVLAVTTGMRRGEIFGLRWSDMDLDSAMLVVNQSLEQTREGGLQFKAPKTAAGRRPLSLPQIAVQALRAHKTEQEKIRRMYGKDYQRHGLVLCEPDGSPMAPDAFSSSYGDFSEKIGLKLRFHDLRHSHASQMLRSGTSVKIVQRRLGHSTSAITLDIYGHLLPGDDQRAADSVNVRLQAELDKQQPVKVS